MPANPAGSQDGVSSGGLHTTTRPVRLPCPLQDPSFTEALENGLKRAFRERRPAFSEFQASSAIVAPQQ